ncbi:MAG TPA: ATP-grasp domain-containing protein [Coxiellaceae bacterium]|nr:MAG: hypothetical protein A3E81_07705 [Gammaproteobacteria bacterium RIFCSPHIGHO2_12_FULL_36_30]HLB57042.1 ATP-grasp domain-containing protein [Coxiellaceae bacterium]
MLLKKQICLIVDAYTTGKYLAPMLIANGYVCWHIQSRSEVILAYQKSFIAENFSRNLIYDGNINAILNAVSEFQVKTVIPGAETGVILADLLSEKLNLPGNASCTSDIRRNKFLMSQALLKSKVPVASFISTNQLPEILLWKKENKLKKIVLKPLLGGGSDHVFICESDNEIHAAFKKILSEKDVFEQSNVELLAQEFIEGQEYIVNTVTINKKHYIVDMWKKFKAHHNGVPINLYSIAIDSTASEFKALSSYTYQVLDALQIRHGAGHTEVMLNEKGPLLIETGARLAGSIDPSAVNEVYGINHIKAVVDAVINPEKFSTPDDIFLKKQGMHFFFSSFQSGKIENKPNFSAINNLSTFHSLLFAYDVNQVLEKTTSLANFPGYGYLIGDEINKIMSDYQLLRHHEEKIYSDMLCYSE